MSRSSSWCFFFFLLHRPVLAHLDRGSSHHSSRPYWRSQPRVSAAPRYSSDHGEYTHSSRTARAVGVLVGGGLRIIFLPLLLPPSPPLSSPSLMTAKHFSTPHQALDMTDSPVHAAPKTPPTATKAVLARDVEMAEGWSMIIVLLRQKQPQRQNCA